MAFTSPNELTRHYRQSHITDHDDRAGSPMHRMPSQPSVGTQDSAVGMYDSSFSDPPVFYSVESTVTDVGSADGHGFAS